MMARIRSVKPELFTHEGLFEAGRDYQLPIQLAFIGLLTQCDQWGRFRWQPKRLKLGTLPYHDVDMVQVLDALVARGFVEKYEVQGEWYGCIPSWSRHQKITRPEHPSGIPSPQGVISDKPTKKNNLTQQKESTPSVPLDEALQHPLAIVELVTQEPSVSHKVSCVKEQGDNSVDTECNLLHTEEEHGGNTVVTERNFLYTEEEHGGNTGGTRYDSGRTRYSGNREYGVGNREQEREVERNNTIVASETRPSTEGSVILQIFEHWRTVMHHPRANLDPKRRTLIAKALNFGYSAEELCQAINGCSITPHNIGDNDRHQRYDGLHVILRDSDQIDRFMHNYHYPPRRLNEAERKTEANVEMLQQWMHKKMAEGTHATL